MDTPVFLLDPTPDAVAAVEREHGVPVGLMAHAMDQHELPRLEKDGNATLVIIRIPMANPRPAEPPFTTVPVGVLVLGARLWVICRCPHPLLEDLARRPAAPQRAAHVILTLLLATAEAFLQHLGTLNSAVDAQEDRVTAAMGNQEVLGLLRLQKSLVFFTTALKANELLLERLRKDPLLDVDAGDHDLLEDALVELRQALEMSRINSDILSNTMDAFASIISNNLNVVMKLLTALTIVLNVPILVASLYGMNVPLPLAGTPWAFVALGAVSALGAGAVAWVFWKKGWL